MGLRHKDRPKKHGWQESNHHLVQHSRTEKKEKGETVETEFRESMIQRLEKGYLLPEQTSLLYSVRETLARLQTPSTLCAAAIS